MESKLPVDNKSDELIKQKILEESFRKANFKTENDKKNKKSEEKLKKRSTSKIGIFLIVISIVSIILMYLGPWVFIQYNADYGSDSVLIFSNTINSDINSKDIIDLLSTNYMGVSLGDFQNAPYQISIGFFALIIIGLIFFMFQVIDKFKKFPSETFIIITNLFAVISFMVGIYIIVITMKFIGSYFLFLQNIHLIDFYPIIVYIMPFLIIINGFLVSKYSYSIIKIYYNQLKSKKHSSEGKYSFFKSSISEGR